MGRALKHQEGVGRATLVERERELARIEALLGEVEDGRGSTLLIEGAPGIGKTALLGVARRRAAERGITVLWARAAALERELAFGVVRQLLEPHLRHLDGAARGELFTGAARLAERPLGLGPDPGAVAGPAPGSELHGLYWLCANLADRFPLLVAIDDLHWADEPSLRFLSYLARRAAEHSLLICAASRPAPTEARGPLLAALGASWEGVVRPRTLSVAGVARVVRETLSGEAEPGFCAACARASGGNPFLLAEALTALRADGIAPLAAEAWRVEGLRPETLSGALLARLARLGPAATRVAHAVATLGADAALRHVARLAELSPDAAAGAVDGLRREGILATGGPLEFVHPLVRNAVHADLAEPARGLAHLAAARLLSEEGAPPERIAPHLLAAEPSADPWVVETLRAAAVAALARGAPAPAASLLERALAEPPEEGGRAPLLIELGRALAWSGRLQEGAETLERALELTVDPSARVEIALELARGLSLARRVDDAAAVLQDASRELGGASSELGLALEVALLTLPVPVGSATELMHRLEAAIDRGAGPAHATALALLSLYSASAASRSADQAAELALEAARSVARISEEFLVPPYGAAALTLAGRPLAAIDLLKRGIEDARNRGDAPQLAVFTTFRSRVALEAGDVRGAEADAQAALEAASDMPLSVSYGLGHLLMALVERGRVDEAEAALEQRGQHPEEEDLFLWALLWARGRLRMAQGRYGEAIVDLRRSGELLCSQGFVGPANWWRSDAAMAHLAVDERPAAHQLATEQVELARAFGAPHALGIGLRTLGLIADGEARLDLLGQSVSALERSESKLELARSLVEHGAALRRVGARRDARAPLRRGLDLASRCGAVPLADRAREELVAAGSRPRRAVLSGPDSLTASEFRVARLAAEGMSNREIAQAVFVTRRTVEMHLTSVYRKLDIESREGLADLLSKQEGVGAS